MFGPATPAVAQDAADRERRHQEAEARLDEPLTRREVLDALEMVKAQYSPSHHTTQIELLERLMEALS